MYNSHPISTGFWMKGSLEESVHSRTHVNLKGIYHGAALKASAINSDSVGSLGIKIPQRGATPSDSMWSVNELNQLNSETWPQFLLLARNTEKKNIAD